MLRSIKSKIVGTAIRIGFTKTTKKGKNLAEIHSFEGAGKSRTIRQILPKDNEDYKKSVLKRAKDHLIKTTSEVLIKTIGRL